MVSVTMPRLGESVQEGTVTRWLKKEGDRVEADEPLLEVSTDKVDTEIPSPAAGVLSKITVNEDETVDVGTELAIIDEGATAGQASDAAPASDASGEAADPEAAQPEPAEAAVAEAGSNEPMATVEAAARTEKQVAKEAPSHIDGSAAPAPEAPAGDVAAPTSDDGDHSYASPLVRKLATENGVDLAAITGTGLGGRIRKQDVLDAAKNGKPEAKPSAAAAKLAAPPAPAAAAAPAAVASVALRGKTEKLSRLRKVIAERMVESLQVSAQLTTVVEVDVTRIARLRDQAKETFEQREGTKLSFLPFFAVAAVEALKAHPVVNSSIDLEAGTVTYHEGIHLGIAVDTERGLLVPVIHDAGDLNLAGIARKVADLADRTRNNKLGPDELAGGTFTLTNTGSRGALFDTPILNQPQVGILGTGAVVRRPVVIQDPELGEVMAVRSMCYLALSYDHRIVDGADAARFLVTIKERLEEGSFESELGLDTE